MADISTISDIYAPGVNDQGQYIDKMPIFAKLPDGIRCECGSRREKVFINQSTFSAHLRTKTHKQWIESLNNQQPNFFKENREMAQTIRNQQLIITRLGNELSEEKIANNYLVKRCNELLNANTNQNQNNLLDFD